MTNLTSLINERVPNDIQMLIYLSGYCAQREGYSIYAVGGFIRDLLLDKKKKEISLVVDGSAVEFAKSLKNLFPGRLQTYEKFGTATFFLQCGAVFDMVTARRELSLHSESLALDERSFLKNDLYRRDFTINTMACSFNSDKFGLLYDYFNGKEDLEKGIIRVLYKLSFVDDPLRIVRAVRLEQRFKFSIEKETLDLLSRAGINKVINRISKERLYNEVILIFQEPSPLAIIYRLKELGFLNEIFPRARFSTELMNNLKDLEDILNSDYSFIELNKINRAVLYLTAIFQKMLEHDVKYLIYLMRLRKKERDKIILMVKAIPEVLETLKLNSLTDSRLNNLLKHLPEEAFPLLYISERNERVARAIYNYKKNLACNR